MAEMIIPVLYRNYRGKVGLRQVVPTAPPRFVSTAQHKQEQWILPVRDAERDVERDFALKDCDFTLGELAGITIRPLVWEPSHGEGYTLFHAKTNLSIYAYGVDVNGITWFSDGGSITDVKNVEVAKLLAEACHRRDVLAEVEKHVELSDHLRMRLCER